MRNGDEGLDLPGEFHVIVEGVELIHCFVALS
jgi:hypothetical protein